MAQAFVRFRVDRFSRQQKSHIPPPAFRLLTCSPRIFRTAAHGLAANPQCRKTRVAGSARHFMGPGAEPSRAWRARWFPSRSLGTRINLFWCRDSCPANRRIGRAVHADDGGHGSPYERLGVVRFWGWSVDGGQSPPYRKLGGAWQPPKAGGGALFSRQLKAAVSSQQLAGS
jgi:hypothetical protein